MQRTQTTTNDYKQPGKDHNKNKEQIKPLWIPISQFFCKLGKRWSLTDANKRGRLNSLLNLIYTPYATHDILIYLFLIRASLELEPP